MDTVDLIIFGGQSNMQGQSECLSESEPVAGAWEYHFLGDTMAALKNPVGEDILYSGRAGEPYTDGVDLVRWLSEHVLGSAAYGYTNLVPSFVRAYIKQRRAAVVAVHAAKGSTQIADWLPGSSGYRMLAAKAAAAIKKTAQAHRIGRIAFVWLQGESDAILAHSKDSYKDSLRLLAGGLKEDLGVECFGIIRVGRFTGDARDDEIIAAQDEICKEDAFFLMLTEAATELNETPGMMNPNVPGHYSARGLETLGALAGAALGNA